MWLCRRIQIIDGLDPGYYVDHQTATKRRATMSAKKSCGDGALHMNPSAVQVGGLLEKECTSSREDESSVACLPGMVSIIMKEMFGLEMPVYSLARTRAFSHFPSTIGQNILHHMRRCGPRLGKEVYWFSSIEAPYGLALKLPWEWPGVLGSDMIDPSKYVVVQPDRPETYWWSTTDATAYAFHVMAGLRQSAMIYVIRIAISETHQKNIDRDAWATPAIGPGRWNLRSTP
ncbi:hypothetical protein Q1695_015510 [Nippostrongylus brasiliensis]|nr:hypothetical protein Q1695_015510 [Nippostrongylus brasiliensis]